MVKASTAKRKMIVQYDHFLPDFCFPELEPQLLQRSSSGKEDMLEGVRTDLARFSLFFPLPDPRYDVTCYKGLELE